MNILCEVNDQTVRRACHLVETHYKDDAFRTLFEPLRFNHTVFYGTQVFDMTKMNLDCAVIKVKPYQTFNPWSNVIGYAIDDDIFVNTRKLSLPLADRVENIMHECFHVAGFSHKGNRVTEYNLKTVPYLASSVFVKYLKSIGVLD